MPVPEDGGRWGILGGAFDPVHYGHLNLGQQVAEREQLDGVLLVPSFKHHFKQNSGASFDDRCCMLEVAIDWPGFVISTIERDRGLSGFTIDTIKALREKYPKAEFYFIIGEDNLGDLDRWHKPEELLRSIPVLAGYRPPHGQQVCPREFAKYIKLVEIDMVDVSSTEARQLLAQDVTHPRLKKLLPEPVLDYIREHGLYTE